MMKNIKLIIIGLIASFMISPEAVFADTYSEHDTYYLNISIDNSNAKYTYEVIEDSNKSSKSMEAKTEYFWFGHFKEFGIIDEVPKTESIKSFTNYKSGDVDDKDKPKLMYSFPAGSSKNNNEDVTGNDQQRANDIGETLTKGLNGIINSIDSMDGTYDINTSEELIEATNLLNEVKSSSYLEGYDIFTVKGYCNIYFGKSLKSKISYDSKEGFLYGYIVPNGEKIYDESELINYKRFVWATQKGYINIDGSPKSSHELAMSGKLTYTEISDKGDAIWITIFNVADTANYKYFQSVNGEIISNDTDPNFVENLITKIFRTFVLGLQNILGLDSIYDLVYNGNSISTESHESGMMNTVWWGVMLKYHLIFQVIAWMLIGLAVAKILIELNFSTINPKTRMSVMETLQKLFVVGFLLVLTIPIMKLLSGINNDVVAIFKTQAQTDTDAFTVGNGLAQLFAYAGYFGILMSLNCVYIMRSIMIAILGATAPLFIVTMAFSNGKGLFSIWVKEITSNIFLQSVHAFTLAFLFEVLDGSGTLEELVILFSLIPITDTFRGWVFQQSESFAQSTGQKLGNAIGSTTKNIAKGIGGGFINAKTDALKLRNNLDIEGQGGNGNSRSTANGEGALQNSSNAYAARSTQLKKEGQTVGSRLNSSLKFSSSNGFAENAKALGSKIGAVTGSSQFASAVSGISGAGSIAAGSFESMGDMMNQANAGNYGEMAESGQQLSNHLSRGTRSGSKVIGSALKGMGENDLRGRMNTDRIHVDARGDKNLSIPNKDLININGKSVIPEAYIQKNISQHPELANYNGQPLKESVDGKKSTVNLVNLNNKYA